MMSEAARQELDQYNTWLEFAGNWKKIAEREGITDPRHPLHNWYLQLKAQHDAQKKVIEAKRQELLRDSA